MALRGLDLLRFGLRGRSNDLRLALLTGMAATGLGMLTPQATGVIAAYRARGLVPVRHLRIEGWSSLLLRKVN